MSRSSLVSESLPPSFSRIVIPKLGVKQCDFLKDFPRRGLSSNCSNYSNNPSVHSPMETELRPKMIYTFKNLVLRLIAHLYIIRHNLF